jgi:PKD repeat protein
VRRYVAAFLIPLLVLSFLTPVISVHPAQASEPTLSEIFNYLGFSNLSNVSTETFEPGNYTITQYAGFAYDKSDIGWYPVDGWNVSNQPPTLDATKIFSSETGGYLSNQTVISLNFTVSSEFGLWMLTNHGLFSGGTTHWFTQDALNPPINGITKHMLIFQNSNPTIWYIGFEDDNDFDYNDVVVELQLLPYVSTTKVTTSMVTSIPQHVAVGSPVNCTAYVFGSPIYPPTGSIYWSINNNIGNFSQSVCTLSQTIINSLPCSSCQTTFTGTDNGTVTIKATYNGDFYNIERSNSSTVFVGQGISIESEFAGDFLNGSDRLSLNNIFGVFTSLTGENVTSVLGTIAGENYTFEPSQDGSYWETTIDMGNLTGTVLQVVAFYTDDYNLTASYNLTIIQIPSWLDSILDWSDANVNKPSFMNFMNTWNNPYEIDVTKEFDLSQISTVTLPLQEYEGGGSYTMLPSIGFEFAFSSIGGNCSISASETGGSVSLQFGMGCVEAYFDINATGYFEATNQSIIWDNATFIINTGLAASYNYPIVGETFDVFGQNVTIGLSATFTFNGNLGAQIVLAPAKNNTQEFISGIGIMIQQLSGDISFGAGIAISAGIGLASITGEADIEVNLLLNDTQPYVSLANVTGTLSIDYYVVGFSGTLWSASGTLWPPSSGDPTNFTVMARYYNTSDYEESEWTNGSLAGTAVHDVYPFTEISAASSGNSAYILYTSDNLSMPLVQDGLYWRGLDFDSGSETLTSIPLPSITNEVFFDPIVTSLPNGTLLAMWDSIPLSEVVNATSPVNFTEIIPQYSCFDTNANTWGLIENLTNSGVATSYLLSSDPTGCYAVVLEGDNVFSSIQSLVEYNLQNGTEMLTVSVPNCSSIVSFDSSSQLALLKMLDGSYELWNLSSSSYTNPPTLDGFQLEDAQFATNSTDSLALLYGNSTSDIFSIYNMTSNMTIFSMNVAQDTSFMTLTQTGSDYQLVTAGSSNLTTSGITNYLIENGTTEQIAFYPMQNITSMGSTSADNGILVYTTENYGNSTNPLLNLTLTFITATPVANFTYSPVPTVEDSKATFDATNSATTIGYINGYQWNFGDGNVTTTPNPIITHLYALPGTYNATLTVGNSVNSTGSTWMLVDVLQLPNASFAYSPTMPKVGGTVTFDASNSTSSGTIVSYVWNFGDSNITTTSNPITTHTYSSGGTYNVTLTISDSNGLKDSTSQILIVYSGPESQVIVTGITTNNMWVYQGRMANVNVTVSNIGNSSQNVWVTLYYNITAGNSIDSYPVYLAAGQNFALLFTWNTVSIPPLNYTLTAVVTIPTGSNTLSNGTLAVRLMGDVNGDGRVNVKDIALVARAFGSTPISPNWNPAADLNGDGVVNMKDIAIVARNFGQQYS